MEVAMNWKDTITGRRTGALERTDGLRIGYTLESHLSGWAILATSTRGLVGGKMRFKTPRDAKAAVTTWTDAQRPMLTCGYCEKTIRYGEDHASDHRLGPLHEECDRRLGEQYAAEAESERRAEEGMSAYYSGYREPTWEDQMEDAYERYLEAI